MSYSEDCVNLAKESEGFAAFPYKDPVGFGTVGYGHRIKSNEDYEDGVTVSEAETILRTDLDRAFEGLVHLVKVPLTQGQVDALTDWVFNLGEGNLSTSTLLKKLNAGLYDEVPAEILRWSYAGGKQLPGLVTRRQHEVQLWNKA